MAMGTDGSGKCVKYYEVPDFSLIEGSPLGSSSKFINRKLPMGTDGAGKQCQF